MISGLSIANGFLATGTDFIPGGGGVFSRAPLWLDHCVVSGNSAAGTATGGGLFGQFGSSLLITNSLVTGNTSIAGGGGMAGSGLFAMNSAIENNAATGTAPGTGSGGGILTNITITNSTISGNTASGDGGGIAITRSFGDVISENTTISGNSAAGKGGGIFLQDASSGLTLFLTTSTISANTAGSQGGGVYVGAGGPAQAPYGSLFADSIIAGNVNGDCAGCPPQSYPNFIGGNPLLGALQNNGGPTKTMLPLPGSPVIGAGQAQPLFIAYQPDPTPATDQRGFPRRTVANAPIDLGAVQTSYTLAFTQQPATVYSGTPLSWSVQAQESGRNYAPNANLPAGGAAPAIPVTLSLTSGVGAIFGNTATIEPATGIASFSALSISAAGSQSLRATSPGFAPVSSTPFTVAPIAPASVAVTAGSGQSTLVNTAFAIPLQVTVRDAKGNPLSGVNVIFSASAGVSFAGVTLSGNVLSDGSGVATAPALTAGSNAGTFTVTANAPGATAATFNLAVAPVALAFSAQSINFTINYGAVPPTSSQTFSVDSAIPVAITATSSAAWLTVPAGIFTSPSSLTATANIKGLAPGSYQASISFTFAGGGGTLPVTLTVVGLPQLVGTPSALSFSASGSQTIIVTSKNRNTAFTVAASAPWINVTANPPNQTPSTLTIAVDAAKFMAGSSPASVVVTAADATNNPLTIPVRLSLGPAAPSLSPGGIVNAASFLPGPAAPNTILTAFGLFPCGSAARVLLNGQPVEVLAASAQQVNFTISGTASANLAVQVDCNGVSSQAFPLTQWPTAPAVFTLAQTGHGQAAAATPDWTFNSPSKPAAVGTSLAIFVTGFGLLGAPGADGLTRLTLPVTAFVGDVTANILYSGAAPGFTSGLQQINIQVPAGAPSGINVPLKFVVGGVSTQPGVTLVIQ